MTISGIVKLCVPPRQSRGVSRFTLAATPTRTVGFGIPRRGTRPGHGGPNVRRERRDRVRWRCHSEGMASFSSDFPLAYHVFPLTAARGIWGAGELRSKAQLGETGLSRRTTREVDSVLGFDQFVHFYLPRRAASFEDLPILRAQLGTARLPAVPHAAIVVETKGLADEECTVCNWNIAVGRPKVEGVCRPGNWSRGTDPDRIAAVWDAFRAGKPPLERARGFWLKPRVPIIPGDCLAEHWRLMKTAGVPELLLESPVRFSGGTRIHVFSSTDASTIGRLGEPPTGSRIVESRFEGYSADGDALERSTREDLNRYLTGDGPRPEIDFDGRRS